MTNDLSNSVIIPREDFVELEAAAFTNSHIPTTSERVAGTLQAAGLFGSMAAAVALGSWGYVTAHDWLDKRRQKRWHAKHDVIV